MSSHNNIELYEDDEEEVNIELAIHETGYDYGTNNDQPVDLKEESLQRNKIWRVLRHGKWTGSNRKALMSCNPKGGRLSWNDKNKIYMFSEGAIKAIYETAMERKTGRYIEGGSNKQMAYGTKVEPLIFEACKIWFAEHYPHLELKLVGFKESEVAENSGSSSDAVALEILKQKVEFSVEMKACTSWGTHYERTFEMMDDKSMDFWQSQAQMEAWEVNYTIYAVAEPPANIDIYLRADNIMEFMEQWMQECKVSFQKVERSQNHQNAMIKRIEIAEAVIAEWNEKGGNLRTVFFNILDEFKERDLVIEPVGVITEYKDGDDDLSGVERMLETELENQVDEVVTFVFDMPADKENELVGTTPEIENIDTVYEVVGIAEFDLPTAPATQPAFPENDLPF